MKDDYLSRPIIVDICKDGTISARLVGFGAPAKRLNDAALPVFSVNTPEEVRDLQTLFCRKMYGPHPEMRKGDPWYAWTDFNGTLESVEGVTRILEDWWQKRQRREHAKEK